MRTNVLRLSLFGLASASLLASCADDATPVSEDTAPNGAVIIRGQPLTPPSSAAPATIVRDFLKARGAGRAVDQLQVTRTTLPIRGISHVTMEQTIDGLRVVGAYTKAAIDSRGQLIQVIDNVVRPSAAPTTATVSAANALAIAFDELGYTSISEELGRSGTKTFFEPGSEFYREPSAELVVYVDDRTVVRQGYLVETWSRVDNVLEQTLVGYDGSVVSTERLTSSDRYNVFVEDPFKGAQTIVAGPGAGNAQSPEGWLGTGAQTTWNISGNNVRSYLDTDANNSPDAGGTAVTNGEFLTAADLSASPGTLGNKNVAVQNLFYLNNVVHDALYAAGFNEAAGNFQVNNFGKGGAGNDPVNAEAQDGSGTDNANFSTPNDGSSPRMQMYLWTPLGDHQVVTTAGQYRAAGAGFGPALTTTGLAGSLALASVADGCTAFTGVTGKIAIIDRGACDFTVKVMNAQSAGAVGAIVANNQGDSVFTMGGTNRKIKIPSVMVGQSDGAALKTQANASATLRKNPNPPPQLDGDVDADIVFHEYGHGLTWRMIGSMSGALSGSIGEGASDTVAFLLNGDDRVGEYSFSDPDGIRRFPYAGYPYTYGDFCNAGCEVHNDGEIYAAAMWRLFELYQGAGLTATDLLHDFVDGMNFTPAGPAFEDMRDGMLQSVAGSARECLVWRAFAQFGVGVGADAVVKRGGRLVQVTESFTLPAACQ